MPASVALRRAFAACRLCVFTQPALVGIAAPDGRQAATDDSNGLTQRFARNGAQRLAFVRVVVHPRAWPGAASTRRWP